MVFLLQGVVQTEAIVPQTTLSCLPVLGMSLDCKSFYCACFISIN